MMSLDGSLAESEAFLTAPARPKSSAMVRISISQAAFDAVAATLPLGSMAFEPELNAKGERLVWLEPPVIDRVTAMRQPGESYSDVILRLIEQSRRDGV
jgi:hypothetical protein